MKHTTENIFWTVRYLLDQHRVRNVNRIEIGYAHASDERFAIVRFRNGHRVHMQLVSSPVRDDAFMVVDHDAVVAHCLLVHDLPDLPPAEPFCEYT